jgi:cysteine desulfurase
MPEPIYLDYNATTPLLPEVAEAMRACWAEPLLNPSSQHEFGRRARRVLEDARERIGELLGAKMSGIEADRVLFTSGGTESNNLAIRGLLEHARRVRRAPRDAPSSLHDHDRCVSQSSTHPTHLIISAVEHPSVTALAEELQRCGHDLDQLGIDARGVVRIQDLENLLRPNTAVVAAMLAQNETGVLQPIAELAAICAKHGVPLHTDAAQVVGKLPVNFRSLGVATMAVAPHKFHGPTGIGALVARHGIDLAPQLFGGFQQAGQRPGTEPVALVVGMCRALELWYDDQHERVSRMRQLRDRFERAILAGWPAAQVIGAGAERLPHTTQIAFVGLDRQALFMALDQAGVACSPGSACASGSSEVSPVLLAMGCDEAVLTSALRFSLGAPTTATEIDEATRRILHCCNTLRRAK